jgi:hypothetical protein
MRIALAALVAMALAAPARGQEFGIYGVGGQVWDAGTPYRFGWGVSLGFLSKPSSVSNRGGLRFTYDMLERGSSELAVPAFRPGIEANIVEGLNDELPLRVMTLRWVFLPHVTRDARAEFTIGGAREEGRNSDGMSALLSGGLALRMAVDRPYWLTVSYERRFNRMPDQQRFDNPTRQTRGAFRVGLVVEPPQPAQPSERQRGNGEPNRS